LFFQAPGDGDASSGAVSYIGCCAPRSGNAPKPQCGHKHTNPSWQLRWFLPTSYASRVSLSDMQRQRHWWSRLRSSWRNQTSQCFRLSSENIGSSYGFGRICPPVRLRETGKNWGLSRVSAACYISIPDTGAAASSASTCSPARKPLLHRRHPRHPPATPSP
jgi:hypothetical protein